MKKNGDTHAIHTSGVCKHPRSPNQVFGIWKNGENGENGGKWGETNQDGKCRNNFQSRRKMGEIREKREKQGDLREKWDGIPRFHSPISPIFPGGL